LVSAGGDIAISAEQADGSPWPIGLDSPFIQGETLTTLIVGPGGVATSGTDYRRWKQGEQWRHHIIDPRSGTPAQTDILTATIIAPDALQAEMAAKTALILGSQAGFDWLNARPEFTGLLVLENGEVLGTERLPQYLWSCL
jgi:FAD:protein FMN transferase